MKNFSALRHAAAVILVLAAPLARAEDHGAPAPQAIDAAAADAAAVAAMAPVGHDYTVHDTAHQHDADARALQFSAQAGQTTDSAASPGDAGQPLPSPFGGTQAVSETALQRIAGREDLSQAVIASNTSTVANNSVGDQSTTGTISFDGQSFEGLRGLAVINANTGNNVSINASLNVNVAIRP